MSEAARLPIAGEANARWTTRDRQRLVLVVVHSLPAAQRLDDVIGLVETDLRVQVAYTQAPGLFGAGVGPLLRSWEVREIPWPEAVHTRVDLAVAAAYRGLAQLRGPIMVLPHGAGYAKRSPDHDPAVDPDRPVYGLDATRLMADDRVVPACVVLSHEEQRAVLAAQCPPAASTALVAGDPCLDRLLVSRADRRAYRASLGLSADQRLVLFASTWGSNSLFARNLELMTAAMRELDARRYRVGALVHPAVWFGHGPRQVRAWLAEVRAAGLMLVEPRVDWRVPMLAADHVIGDHGSATAYAAALGIPVLHTGFPAEDVHESSAQAWLAQHTPRFDPARPLAMQLRAAAAVADEAWRTAVTERISSRPGHAHRLLRTKMYELLGLSMPGRHRAAEPIPLPLGPADPTGVSHVG
jgi:hypothetical protein